MCVSVVFVKKTMNLLYGMLRKLSASERIFLRIPLVLLLAALIITSLGSCKGLPIKTNRYYSDKEFEMVEKSATAIGLGFGYDSRNDINYFFFRQPLDKALLSAAVTYKDVEAVPVAEDSVDAAAAKPAAQPKAAPKGKKGAAAKSEPEKAPDPSVQMRAAFIESLASYDDRDFTYFYLKAYSVYVMNVYRTDYYKRHKNWRLYNQARLDYQPAAEWYMKYLDAYCEVHRASVHQEIVVQKEEVQRDAILEFQKRITITDEY